MRHNADDSTHKTTPTIHRGIARLATPPSIVHTLLLNLEIAVRLCSEVALVEVMYAHEAVLPSRRIAVALWRNSDPVHVALSQLNVRTTGRNSNARVDRTEVTLDAADLLLQDLVPESRLELTLPERGRRDTHRVLTTTEQYIGFKRCDGGAVQRSLGHICLQHYKRARLV